MSDSFGPIPAGHRVCRGKPAHEDSHSHSCFVNKLKFRVCLGHYLSRAISFCFLLTLAVVAVGLHRVEVREAVAELSDISLGDADIRVTGTERAVGRTDARDALIRALYFRVIIRKQIVRIYIAKIM